MVEFMQPLLELLLSASPILVVLIVFEHIAKIRKKKADERQLEEKKGIIREKYTLKTEKILTLVFVVAVFLFGWGTIASAIQQDDLFPPLLFGVLCLISIAGSLNMIMWKLEVN